jgi:mono/diheme cytochrome c family protein
LRQPRAEEPPLIQVMAKSAAKADGGRGSEGEVEMAGSRVALAVVVAVAVWAAPLTGEAQRPEPGPQDWWGPRTTDWERMWPRGTQRDRWEPGSMGVTQHQRMLRHWTFMNDDVPAAYRGVTSPMEPTQEVIAQGADLYAANCARCHGAIGYGDGSEGRSLVPSPALLAYLVQRPMAGDEYLVWAIAEGGMAFGTEMPAYRNALTEEEIWAIIAYMRAGFSSYGTE